MHHCSLHALVHVADSAHCDHHFLEHQVGDQLHQILPAVDLQLQAQVYISFYHALKAT